MEGLGYSFNLEDLGIQRGWDGEARYDNMPVE